MGARRIVPDTEAAAPAHGLEHAPDYYRPPRSSTMPRMTILPTIELCCAVCRDHGGVLPNVKP